MTEHPLPPRGRYLAHEAGRLAGVSGQTIGQWARRGYIRSSQSFEAPRVYSFQDVAEAMVVHELLDRGIDHRAIKHAIRSVQERFGSDWPLSTTSLATSRGHIVNHGDGADYDVSHRGWQQFTPDPDDLTVIARQLQRGGWAARDLPQLSHIEVDPDRLSGRPVIRGTRVPADLIAELATQPGGAEEAKDGYDVTDEEIADAVDWWQAVRAYGQAA